MNEDRLTISRRRGEGPVNSRREAGECRPMNFIDVTASFYVLCVCVCLCVCERKRGCSKDGLTRDARPLLLPRHINCISVIGCCRCFPSLRRNLAPLRVTRYGCVPASSFKCTSWKINPARKNKRQNASPRSVVLLFAVGICKLDSLKAIEENDYLSVLHAAKCDFLSVACR